MSDYKALLMGDYKALFASAISALARIDEALGIGEDACGEPGQTIFAIHEMQERIRELESALRMVLDDPESLEGRPRTLEVVKTCITTAYRLRLLGESLSTTQRRRLIRLVMRGGSVWSRPNEQLLQTRLPPTNADRPRCAVGRGLLWAASVRGAV